MMEGIEKVIFSLQHDVLFCFFFMLPQRSVCCIGFLRVPKVLLYKATVITFIFKKRNAQTVEDFFKDGEK